MLDIHVKQNLLDADETDIMRGAMHFKAKVVASVMTPIDQVYSLPTTTKLTLATIRHIYQQGYSRIPVYHKDIHDIVGLIFVKDLIFADPAEETTLLHFVHVFGRGVHRVWPDSTLGDVLQAFKMGRTHLALVHDVNNAGPVRFLYSPGDPFYETKGIVTLEDIVEEILQADIYDESDQIDADVTRKNRLSHRSYDTGVDRVILDDDRTKKLAKPEFILVGVPLDVAKVSNLLSQSHLLEFRAQDSPHAELLTQGKATNGCVIVLQGHVIVSTKRGLWSLFGAHALLECDAESDLTVDLPPDEYVRCVRVSRLDFQATLFPMNIAEQPAVLAERRLEIQIHQDHNGSIHHKPLLSPVFHSDLDQSEDTDVPYTLDNRESM
ncbi:hypothetical protein DYB36_009753 [Aphanomyces astaci]|uniref:CBS domain-containing protein n=1 Tax=Aphanomyces astaci TaxID=112090 RepID=A0A397A3P0_APHAT|nr:hypothetical protein DYB36_009753 [Aphanomyces astaci]